MVARLQTWFARQSLTVKLLVTIPVLLGALFWSVVPGSDTRAPDPGNRPVLSSGTTTAGTASTTSTGATGATSASGAVASTPAAALLPHEEPRPVDTGLSWSSAIRTLASIAVVIVLILLSAQGLKYLMAGAAQPLRANQTIRVVETLHLPSPSGRGRAAVHLVEVGEQLLLLGATDTQLSLLTEIPDDDASRHRRQSRTAGSSQDAPPDGSFADLLAQADAGDTGDGGAVAADAAAPRARTAHPGNGTARGQRASHGPGDRPTNGRGHVDEADLAQLLQRLRDSRQRLEGEE